MTERKSLRAVSRSLWIAVAANMVTASLGTETDGSIICPSAANSVVGIKPTVGLTTSQGWGHPCIAETRYRRDIFDCRPICRTVSDAVRVLEAIVGFDERDAEATGAALKYIPREGYRQFLKADGLRGKRVGLLRNKFLEFPRGSIEGEIFEEHFDVMRKKGAILVDNLEIENVDTILDDNLSGRTLTLLAEFKISLNAYLSDLSLSPMRSLLDVILFNNKHGIDERVEEYGQPVFLEAQNTSGLGPTERRAIAKMAHLSKQGLERLMIEKQLDAVVTADATFTSVLAIGGYPGISVPAGYGEKGVPFGICFGGLKGSEPKLIEIAYGFEQATKARKLPMFKP
ncbi:uncharacterized protein A4U43_C10F16630 [Asparagus officinalis]|uniref:Amidase domain-containing protein n=1 Tax=Asparagus officinalis TaxID=4686 RepID=A0A5P1E390_ASPOF|nr:uncharacterized protein A4U43_C10F16630 [Asparagus officinalis]